VDKLLEGFLVASGGSLFGALILFALLRLFDEPLKALMGIAVAKEVESFKNQLGEKLESLRHDLQRSRELESFYRAKRIAFLEQQLSSFYWPLHLRLQRDDVVWRKILERDSPDETRKAVARGVDQHVLLPNHREMVAIIEKGLHLARPDAHLEELLLRYVRHVAVYTALRESGNYHTDPFALGEPYPKDLSSEIERRTRSLQSELDHLMQLEASGVAPEAAAPESATRVASAAAQIAR
jgi:hypothetical protein